MEPPSVKASWIILMIPCAISVVLGLFVTVVPGVFIGQGYKSFLGQPWSDLVASNSNLSLYISLHFRLMGILMALLGALLVVIDLTAYRRGEKWAWYAFLVSSTLAWGSGLALDAIQGLKANVVMEAIVILIVYVGLAISAKTMLTKTGQR